MDPEMFFKAVRMSPQKFDMVFELIGAFLEKKSYRKPISAECRLFLTLLFLANGGSRQVYCFTFKIGLSTFGKIVYETCKVLWDELSPIYLSPPNESEWLNIANEFENRWRLPNCIGAIDGKHINIVCPPNGGSQFYNYKGRHSIVLLAVCDAQYCFTMVDIGAYGSQSDGGVFFESSFGKLFLNNKLKIPESAILPQTNEKFPFFLVGDNAFPLKKNLMRPFPGKCGIDEQNFNKRISHARVTIENTFGILSSRWRILRNDIHAIPSNVDVIVKATVLLHNLLMLSKCPSYCPNNYADRVVNNEVLPGEWRNAYSLRLLPPSRSHNNSREAFRLRQQLCQYLNFFK